MTSSATLTATDGTGADPTGPDRRTPKPKSSQMSRARSIAGAAFLAPNLILVSGFLLVPLIWAFVISMQKRESLGEPIFLGFNNFIDLLQDPTFWEASKNTLIFTILTVPVGMAMGLGIAMLLNGVLPGRTLYRSIIFLPLVLSGVSTGLIGAWIFDQYNGFINKFLNVLGLEGPNWQSDGTWAMVSVVIITLWVRVGFDMIIYLAGLQGISPDVLEAAKVDGATGWRRFRSIIFPLLGPSTFFLLIMNLIYSFQVFDTVFAMTGGGPGNSTTMLVTYAYSAGFAENGLGQLGYAAAIGVVIYLITLVITAIQWKTSRSRDLAG